ncbi:glycosyltransferase [Candidatus Uhrbacteria bacterium]|nr:glycosyltransferase [Candidatus Uhrbacteria bacterium]
METVSSPPISVIIPAYHDAKRLRRTLERLVAIREREYQHLEIVVSVRPSMDETEAIARRYADRVVYHQSLGEARNRGAAVAQGEYFIFLDADAAPRFGTIPIIVRHLRSDRIGTCTVYPDRSGWKPWLAATAQNFVRWSGMIKGIPNLLFCHRSLMHERGVWFNPLRSVGEYYELIARARKSGVHFYYARIAGGGYAVNVDRYERWGYAKTLWFWIRWAFYVSLLQHNGKALEREYWVH